MRYVHGPVAQSNALLVQAALIAFVTKYQVVLSPPREKNTSKKKCCSLFVKHKALCGQGPSYLPREVRLCT